ncbi:protein odr-4 homolog [Lycorma delicatula]|uniref:protein odr-4 homolog n=1 Tax=Lycorma delicatula TaxID=130591 RepID=UPI003F514440
MGRTVYAEEKLLPDLENFASFGGYIPGLILGQASGNKDFVIHLARTSLHSTSSQVSSGDVTDNVKIECVSKLTDISESSVADHARQVTRMLPGGMWVLGIFIIGPGDLFNDASCQSKMISLLSYMYKCLSRSPYLHGNSPASEKLVFHLSTDTKKYSCRSVDIQMSAATSLKPVDWKFQSGCTKWHQLDCFYDCEQIVPHLIINEKSASPLRKHLQEILSNINNIVTKAICTIDGEIKDNADSLEVTDKKKKGKQSGSKGSSKEDKTLEVNLFTPCELIGNNDDSLEIVNISGEMRCNGALSCRVFLHQKASVEEAIKAVKDDIIRSFSCRLEMHWDSLVEEELGSPEDRVVLHEPPRRVLIPLPYSKVALCDYLFPGEGASESLIALQELLGLNLSESAVQKDFEGQMDPSQLYELTNNPETTIEERSQSGLMTSSYVLIGGIVVAVIVLLASILIQYTMSSKHNL